MSNGNKWRNWSTWKSSFLSSCQRCPRSTSSDSFSTKSTTVWQSKTSRKFSEEFATGCSLKLLWQRSFSWPSVLNSKSKVMGLFWWASSRLDYSKEGWLLWWPVRTIWPWVTLRSRALIDRSLLILLFTKGFLRIMREALWCSFWLIQKLTIEPFINRLSIRLMRWRN